MGLKPPGRVWRYPRGQWSGRWITRADDEYGRHTLVIPTPFGAFVFVTRNCPMTGRCEFAAEFRCVKPGCRYMAIGPGGMCPAHDSEWEDEAA